MSGSVLVAGIWAGLSWTSGPGSGVIPLIVSGVGAGVVAIIMLAWRRPRTLAA
jgi:uncharacterized membrane-anchored protein